MISATLINGADASSSINSGAFYLGDLVNASVDAVFSGGAGDLAGTFKLQASSDGTNFVDVTGQSQSVTAAAYKLLNFQSTAPYVRVVWTFSSGTGNLTSVIRAKETLIKGA